MVTTEGNAAMGPKLLQAWDETDDWTQVAALKRGAEGKIACTREPTVRLMESRNRLAIRLYANHVIRTKNTPENLGVNSCFRVCDA
jgi:hypothetical protein